MYRCKDKALGELLLKKSVFFLCTFPLAVGQAERLPWAGFENACTA